ncbi:MAG TPA: arylesterase [Steroidobacteraceae bacterium]|nr:arylesterase [Steroidobacteraceae bacterium]
MSRVIGVLSFLWLLLPLETVRAAALPAPVILVFGDSISAGYGMAPESGWVNLLSNRLRQEGYGFQVVNASVSGETTTGGLARLPRALAAHAPRIVIIELGGNDGLRGLPLGSTRANLDAMIGLAARPGRSVLLLGLHMPPNYGERYTTGFAGNYTVLAQAHRVPLVPFLLEGIAGRPALMQGDGLHPNERGQPILLDNVWPVLKPLLRVQPH